MYIFRDFLEVKRYKFTNISVKKILKDFQMDLISSKTVNICKNTNCCKIILN